MLFYQRSLVLSQFIWAGLLIGFGNIFVQNIFLLIIEILGILFAFYSMIVMKYGNFNIISQPKKNGVLRKKGVYKYIRHPMYLGLLVSTLPFVIEEFNILNLVFWLCLLITLIFKMNFEERLLINHFEDYQDYKKLSWKLLPFLY